MTENVQGEWLSLAKELVAVLEQDDADRADAIMEKIARTRETVLFQDMGRLTRQLHDSMNNFSTDTKIFDWAENDIPDAKERLNYVISMTEKSAHQTLTAVESLRPISQKLNDQANILAGNWERFLSKDMPFAEFKDMSKEITQYFNQSVNSLADIQSGLDEILMAQGFQDVTGQIIRRVIKLVQDVETSMVELIKISGGKTDHSHDELELPGPAVPGIDDKKGDVVTSQDDVDDLLSSLGF
jgi:chemotaxis protein CheZ